MTMVVVVDDRSMIFMVAVPKERKSLSPMLIHAMTKTGTFVVVVVVVAAIVIANQV